MFQAWSADEFSIFDFLRASRDSTSPDLMLRFLKLPPKQLVKWYYTINEVR